MNIYPKDEKPICKTDPNYEQSSILAGRKKGNFSILSSPMPVSPWWETTPARPLGEVLWIEDEQEQMEALQKSLPPTGELPPSQG